MRTRTTEAPTELATPAQLRQWSLRCHAAGMSVGLVPTMGALHAGHRSLIRRAVAECDRVVVSIFVNPAQFGPGEDLERYPRTPVEDLRVLRDERVDAVYLPAAADVYPPGFATRVALSGPLVERFEAAHRPGHFEGVALVVTKLLVSARPDRAYFGRKDAQQCAVVSRLAADLDTGVDIVLCPTVRERDGLAASSRNVRLNRDERCKALAIPRGLARAAHSFDSGERSARALRAVVEDELTRAGVSADYVSVVDADFGEVHEAAAGTEILVAAKIGETRLIDQVRLGIDTAPVVGGAAGAPSRVSL